MSEGLTVSLRMVSPFHKRPAEFEVELDTSDFEEIVDEDDYGFPDIWTTKNIIGFHVYYDDELAHILKYKASQIGMLEANVLVLHFRQNTPGLSVEVDLSNSLHKKLASELESLPSQGEERTKALARINTVAKKMGLESHKSTGGLVLATDLSLEWQEQKMLTK